jgi:hypothetical protein
MSDDKWSPKGNYKQKTTVLYEYFAPLWAEQATMNKGKLKHFD